MKDHETPLVKELDPVIDRRFWKIEKDIEPFDERITANTGDIRRLAEMIDNVAVARRNGRFARNAGAIAGLAVIGYGCWLITPSLAWIVLGCILFGGSVAGMVAVRNQGIQGTRDA